MGSFKNLVILSLPYYLTRHNIIPDFALVHTQFLMDSSKTEQKVDPTRHVIICCNSHILITYYSNKFPENNKHW